MFYGQSNQILMLSREKLSGGARHFGVQLPDGRVAECCFPEGVRIVTLDVFAQGRDVRIEEERSANEWPAIAARLSQALEERRTYHATAWNCEVFANWLIGERPVSKQVVAAMVILAAIGALIIMNNPRSLAAIRI